MAPPGSEHRQVWDRAPTGPSLDLGVSVQLRHTADFDLVMDQVHVHGSGVSLRLCGTGAATWSGRKGRRHLRDDISVSVSFSDGRAAHLDDSAGIRSGVGPVVTWARSAWRSAEPTGDTQVEFVLWIWPLPPPGPVTVALTWADGALEDTVVQLDGTEIRRLARELPEPPISGSDAPTPPAPAPVGNEVEVPDVVGMGAQAARSLARASGLFLEYSDADGPPLASGVIVRQEPGPGTTVPRFTPVKAWVRDALPGSGFRTDPGGPHDGGPSGGVREPRRPLPGTGGTSIERMERGVDDLEV